MEKEVQISLYEYLSKKTDEYNGSPIFYYGKSYIDKEFCILYEKFQKDIWNQRFNPSIRENKTDKEVHEICIEMRKNFLNMLRVTLVSIPDKT